MRCSVTSVTPIMVVNMQRGVDRNNYAKKKKGKKMALVFFKVILHSGFTVFPRNI